MKVCGTPSKVTPRHSIELLEERRAPAVVTTVFDFDGYEGSGYTTLEMENGDLIATVTRPDRHST